MRAANPGKGAGAVPTRASSCDHRRVELTIAGAGAIGGLVGAHLWRAGHAVRLVDRDRAHVEAIRTRGLEVGGRAGFVTRVPACLPEETPGGIGALLLAVKALDTEAALAPLVSLLAPDGWVVSMQNGLEEERIAALVGRARTVAACLTFGGYYERPGRVVYSGPGTLRVGEPDGRMSDRVEALARALADFHPAAATPNIQGFRWTKLILGTIYFATATVDADVVEILADAGARRRLAGLAGEGLAVAEALGIAVEPLDGFDPRGLRGGESESEAARATWEAQRAYWQRGVAGRTGIWRDLAVRRRRTEAGPILGALVAAANRVGHPVPRVRALLDLFGELERGRRPLAWENLAAIAGA
jgi:2-dehydropantoate 2-reductase